MKKSLLMKSISILLVLTLMTSTITFCLGGCSVKITPNRADIDIPTYSDTRLEVSSQNVSNNYVALTNALKSNDTEEIKEKADALKDAVNQSLSEFKLYSEEIRSMIGDSDDIIKKKELKNLKSTSTKILKKHLMRSTALFSVRKIQTANPINSQ